MGTKKANLYSNLPNFSGAILGFSSGSGTGVFGRDDSGTGVFGRDDDLFLPSGYINTAG